MALPKGTRIGLLLILTAGPFLVFLFLYLFGKNHFETDRYDVSLRDILPGGLVKAEKGFLLADTGNPACGKNSLKAQIRRFELFTEDFGQRPAIQLIYAAGHPGLSSMGREWFLSAKYAKVKTARSSGGKHLPPPPRALLFDSAKTLRGVYGLCDEKSVDSLMLEYRILLTP